MKKHTPALLVAAVCARRGDLDGRRLELETARRLFTELTLASSTHWAMSENGPRISQRDRSASREQQVLRLLATGKSNRAIADDSVH